MSNLYFRNVIGQKDAVGHLQNALRTGQLSHAYILCGEKGTGRQALAGAFAAALQCENRQSGAGSLEACGICPSCIQAASDSHPDILWLTGSRKSDGTDAALGIEDIRAMRADVRIRPYSSAHKVYILQYADKMTPQAQNALLKTLEEPPEYAVVLLLAQGVEGFLPTVTSRCVTLRLRPAGEQEICSYLTDKTGITQQEALFFSRVAMSNPGRALTLAEDPAYRRFLEQVLGWLRRPEDWDSFRTAKFAEDAAAGRLGGEEGSGDYRAEELIGLLQGWYRDVLVYRSTGSTDALIFQEEVQYIISAAQRLGYAQLQEIFEAMDTALRRRFTGGNEAQILELMLLRIRNAQKDRR